MLIQLFGNKTKVAILMALNRQTIVNPTSLARELKIPLNMVQKQLAVLFRGGIVVTFCFGKKRFYRLNDNAPAIFYISWFLKKIGTIHEEAAFYPDAFDQTHLSVRDRLREAETLSTDSFHLLKKNNPLKTVKAFDSFQAYEKWKETHL